MRGTASESDELLRSAQLLQAQITVPVTDDELVPMAMCYDLSFYDAAYLNLALREHLPFATLDNALIRAAQTAGVALFQP